MIVFLIPVIHWLFISSFYLIEIQAIDDDDIAQKVERVHNLRKALDDLPKFPYGQKCSPQDESNYNQIQLQIEQGIEEELFKLPIFDLMSNQLNKINEANQAKPKEEQIGFFCSFQKGMTCSKKTETCSCNDGSDNSSKTYSVRYHEEEDVCHIEEDKECDPNFPVSCCTPFQCFMDKTSSKTPQDIWTPCTEPNRRAFDLQETDLCRCELTDQGRLGEMKRFLTDIVNLPFKKYEDRCNHIVHDFVFGKNGLVAAVFKGDASYYDNVLFKQHRQKYNHTTTVIANSRKPSGVCDMRKALYCVENKAKYMCDCFAPAIYDKETEECIVPKGGPCIGESNPYPCESGYHCLFDGVKVLCTKENKVDIITNKLKMSDTCSCASKSEPFKRKFNDEIIQELKIEAKKVMVQELTELKKALWTVVEKGEPCDWWHDRDYFEMQDFIFAGKEEAYYDMPKFGNLKEKSEASDFKKMVVCDLKKSMRCGFLSKVCECPVVSYFSELITSEFDSEKDRCVLLKGSRCYSTLGEWLPCQKDEVCAYDAVPVLCNRNNKNIAIKEMLRFSTAACSCVPQKDGLPKVTFDEEIIRKHSIANKHDEL